MSNKPRPDVMAALASIYPELAKPAQTFTPTSPEEVLLDLGGAYYIAFHSDLDPIERAKLEARLSDHLREHFLGTVVALADEFAVIVDSSTPAGKLEFVPFQSAI